MLGIATMKMNFSHIHHDILTPARSGKNRKLGGMTGFPKYSDVGCQLASMRTSDLADYVQRPLTQEVIRDPNIALQLPCKLICNKLAIWKS